MITLLNLNPCFDVTAYADTFSLDAPNRLHGARRDMGGKALDAAIVLKNLFGDEETVCLAGCDHEEDGLPLQRVLKEKNILSATVPVPGSTRVNTKIHVRGDGRMIEFSLPSPEVPPEDAEKIRALFLEKAAKSAFVLMCGSLPPGFESDTYAALGDILRDRHIPFAVDADGEALLRALRAAPTVIKPNENEFARLYAALFPGEEAATDTPERAIACARRVVRRTGVGILCLSLGGAGSVITDGKESFFCEPPDVVPLALQGAGDAMLAGIVYGYVRGFPTGDMLRMGTAASGATIALPGTQMGQKDEILRLFRKTRTRAV